MGEIRNQRIVSAIMRGGRPKWFRCSICGLLSPGDAASLTLSWVCRYSLSKEEDQG